MKLLSVEIKNFRSLKDVKVSGPKDDVWTLIGQNNAGKSCVIHALRAFYGDYNVIVEDFFRGCDVNANIEIILDFHLDEDEFSQLPEFYKLPENRLKVIKRFTRDNLKGKSHGFENKDGIIVERDEDFFGAKNVPMGKLGNIIYVPAVKGLSEELKQVKSSIFTKLLTRIISDTLESLPSWTNLVQNTKSFAQDLRSPAKNSGNLNSINEIEDDLTQKLSSWKLRTKITLLPPTPEDIVLTGSQLRFISEETNQEEDPMFLGSGAQRAIVNNLLLLWAEIESKKDKVDKKKFNGNFTLLLYEEPEALLHYDQERKLLTGLEKIAGLPTGQVIICTHSPNLISTKSDALSSISRLIRKDGRTDIFRAGEEFLQSLKSEEDIFNFILWLNPDRNTMFFVDEVILVEGSTDKVFLNYLIFEKELGLNIYVIDCGGKYNIPRFMTLCSEFGIKHKVMFDGDDEIKDDNKKRNDDIFDKKSDYTSVIKKLLPNLEGYLGFIMPGSHSQKPIEMLNSLRQGKLNSQKENEFLDFLRN